MPVCMTFSNSLDDLPESRSCRDGRGRGASFTPPRLWVTAVLECSFAPPPQTPTTTQNAIVHMERQLAENITGGEEQ